jgi:hypothetical protein
MVEAQQDPMRQAPPGEMDFQMAVGIVDQLHARGFIAETPEVLRP